MLSAKMPRHGLSFVSSNINQNPNKNMVSSGNNIVKDPVVQLSILWFEIPVTFTNALKIWFPFSMPHTKTGLYNFHSLVLTKQDRK